MWSGWVQGNSNGPLVPMVRLVPMEKHSISMVLFVNMHLIKGTLIIFPCGLAGYPFVYIGHVCLQRLPWVFFAQFVIS